MDKLHTLHDYFLEAFRHSVLKEDRGIMETLSIDTKTSRSHLSKVLSSNNKTKASIKLQNKISKAFGYSRNEFLMFGKKLVEGELIAVRIRKSKEKTKPLSGRELIIDSYEDSLNTLRNEIIRLEDENKELRKELKSK